MIQALSNLSCDLHEQMEVGTYYFHFTRLPRAAREVRPCGDDTGRLRPQPLSCPGTEEALQKGRMGQPGAVCHWPTCTEFSHPVAGFSFGLCGVSGNCAHDSKAGFGAISRF